MITPIGGNSVADAGSAFLDAYVKAHNLTRQDEQDRQIGLLRQMQMKTEEANMQNQKTMTGSKLAEADQTVDENGNVSFTPEGKKKRDMGFLGSLFKEGAVPVYDNGSQQQQPGQGLISPDNSQAPQPKGLIQPQDTSAMSAQQLNPTAVQMPSFQAPDAPTQQETDSGAGPLPQKKGYIDAIPQQDQSAQPAQGLIKPQDQSSIFTGMIGIQRDPNDPMAAYKRAEAAGVLGRLNKYMSDAEIAREKLDSEKDYRSKDLDIKKQSLDTRNKQIDAQIARQQPLDAARIKYLNSTAVLQNKRLQLNEQTRASTMSKSIDEDPLIKSSIQAQNAADRGLELLSGPTVTNQAASTFSADLARVVTGGGNPAQGTIHEQQFNSVYGKFQGLLQQVTGDPQDALPDGLKKQMVSTMKNLKEITKRAQAARAKNLIATQSDATSDNPYAAKALKGLSSRYVDPVEHPAPDPQDQAAMQWLKSQNPNDPMALKVIQKLKAKGLM